MGLKSRHIDERIPMASNKTKPPIDELIKQFRETEIERIRTQYSLNKVSFQVENYEKKNIYFINLNRSDL